MLGVLAAGMSVDLAATVATIVNLNRRLLKAFPRLRSIDHGSALERLHRQMENLKKR